MPEPVYLYYMKIILTESQIKRIKLSEQMIGVSDYNPMKGGPMPNYGKALVDVIAKLSVDDAVDITSAAIDTVPEIGNAISLGIDGIHALTYAYRYAKTNNEMEKIEFGIMSILSAATAVLPVTGNLANIAARGGIKGMIRRTPEEILHVAQKLGLYNKKIWPIQKTKWTFNTQLFLYKITRGQIANSVAPILKKLKGLSEKVIGTPLERSLIEFRDVVDDIQKNRGLLEKMSQHV